MSRVNGKGEQRRKNGTTGTHQPIIVGCAYPPGGGSSTGSRVRPSVRPCLRACVLFFNQAYLSLLPVVAHDITFTSNNDNGTNPIGESWIRTLDRTMSHVTRDPMVEEGKLHSAKRQWITSCETFLSFRFGPVDYALSNPSPSQPSERVHPQSPNLLHVETNLGWLLGIVNVYVIHTSR